MGNKGRNDYLEKWKRLGQLFRLFAGLAIFISCFDLFGLAAFTLRQKKKAVAVRKVMGVTVGNIVAMTSKDLLKPVVLGMVLAAPVAMLEQINGRGDLPTM